MGWACVTERKCGRGSDVWVCGCEKKTRGRRREEEMEAACDLKKRRGSGRAVGFG
jgi:hypothetical protein